MERMTDDQQKALGSPVSANALRRENELIGVIYWVNKVVLQHSGDQTVTQSRGKCLKQYYSSINTYRF